MRCCFVFLIVALQGFLALGNAIRIGSIGASNIFNVIDYGAVGDGLADDSQAFLKAWGELCNVVGDGPTLIVPAGKTFLLTPFLFRGPCKSSSIHIEIQGSIVAPDNLDAWRNCEGDAWMSFQFIDNLIVDGLGSINGKGLNFWHKQVSINQVQQEQSCHRPKALSFTHCNGLKLSSVTVIDSPGAHVVLTSCNDSILSKLTITAPEDSPNTDGIDLTMSTNVQIHDSFIGTGDDCIAIGTEMSIVNISGITCGPGHGISIGSLGRDGASAKVEGIHVQHCTFNKTMCGARIKTWEGGSGYARNISYENMILIDVHYPIIIDQHYNLTNEMSAVEVSDVRYSGFVGTSATLAAISLNCSETVACTNIAMESIQITSSNPAQTAVAVCQNARGTANLVEPPVPCLQRLQ